MVLILSEASCHFQTMCQAFVQTELAILRSTWELGCSLSQLNTSIISIAFITAMMTFTTLALYLSP